MTQDGCPVVGRRVEVGTEELKPHGGAWELWLEEVAKKWVSGILEDVRGRSFRVSAVDMVDGSGLGFTWLTGSEENVLEPSIGYAWCFDHGRMHRFLRRDPWCDAAWVHLKGNTEEEASRYRREVWGEAQFLNELSSERQLAALEEGRLKTARLE
ncbi:hypothetical protein [Streptomyces cucumeris]|uniref:hypothetical protein n=1 Tax=Streptomyces cucumeris TaxID=2962890 RepID=UPI0020C8FED4|nr:hypothetical protein [Streptomyces sp. NEAU-Y11]MCP9209517.1 hypothetical protein [Streptomyces sp. NEAU-Y11]